MNEEKLAFRATCPRGHSQAYSLAPADITQPAVIMYCIACGAHWRPTEAQEANLRRYAASRGIPSLEPPAVEGEGAKPLHPMADRYLLEELCIRVPEGESNTAEDVPVGLPDPKKQPD